MRSAGTAVAYLMPHPAQVVSDYRRRIRSAIVWSRAGWSHGSRNEIAFARRLWLPVFVACGHPVDWLAEAEDGRPLRESTLETRSYWAAPISRAGKAGVRLKSGGESTSRTLDIGSVDWMREKMARYRFGLPVLAIGDYRLPMDEFSFGTVTLKPNGPPAYMAMVRPVEAANVKDAYEVATHRVESVLELLALVGHRAAFVLDGQKGVEARNLDIEEAPISVDQPPPQIESLFGSVFKAGLPLVDQLDPTGNMRRHGQTIVSLNVDIFQTPPIERIRLLQDYSTHLERCSPRVRIALGLVHDAACAREVPIGFVQAFTALEVLVQDLEPGTICKQVLTNAHSDELRIEVETLFRAHGFASGQIDRIVQQIWATRAVSRLTFSSATSITWGKKRLEKS